MDYVIHFLDPIAPEDDPELQGDRMQLANAMYEQGEYAGARRLEEEVLSVRERTLPEEGRELHVTRGNLANTLCRQGELAPARRLREEVVAAFERTLKTEDPDLLHAWQLLAVSMMKDGDLPGARALLERTLTALEANRPLDGNRPDGDHMLQIVRVSLAVALKEEGDLARARDLEEKTLAALPEELPPTNSAVQTAQMGLPAVTVSRQRDFAGARKLEEAVLSSLLDTHHEDDREVQETRINLAVTMSEQGEVAAACETLRKAVEVLARILSEGDPDLQNARQNLANLLCGQGELSEARKLQAKCLEVYGQTFPHDHPRLQRLRCGFALTLAQMGEDAGASKLLSDLAETGIASLSKRRGDSLREREEMAGGETQTQVELFWSLTPFAARREALERLAFEWIEARRAVADQPRVEIADLADAARVEALRRSVAATREEVAKVTSGRTRGPVGEDDKATALAERKAAQEDLVRAVERRDRAERELNAALERLGAFRRRSAIAALAHALPRGERRSRASSAALVGRPSDEETSPGPGPRATNCPRSSSRPTAACRWSTSVSSHRSRRWRSRMACMRSEAPIVRGAAPVTRSEAPVADVELGEAASQGGVRPDPRRGARREDVLHVPRRRFAPRAARGAAAHGRAASSASVYRLRFETSFTRLIAGARNARTDGTDEARPCSALLIGAVDYDVNGDDAVARLDVAAGEPAVERRALRSPAALPSEPFDQTAYEADAIAGLLRAGHSNTTPGRAEGRPGDQGRSRREVGRARATSTSRPTATSVRATVRSGGRTRRPDRETIEALARPQSLEQRPSSACLRWRSAASRSPAPIAAAIRSAACRGS